MIWIILLIIIAAICSNKDRRRVFGRKVVNAFYWFSDNPKRMAIGIIVIIFVSSVLKDTSKNIEKASIPEVSRIEESQGTTEETQNQEIFSEVEETQGQETVRETEETGNLESEYSEDDYDDYDYYVYYDDESGEIYWDDKSEDHYNEEGDSENSDEKLPSIWSKEFLYTYVNAMPIEEAKKYLEIASEYIAKIEEKQNDNVEKIYLKLNQKFFDKPYFSITSEKTKYLYIGELKDNKPSGFGAIWVKVNDYEILLYCGNFTKGRYDGTGIEFEECTESRVSAAYPIMNGGIFEANDEKDYLETIRYIGDFKDGERDGKGVEIEYPDLENYISRLYLSQMTSISDSSLFDPTISVGEFENGKFDGDFDIYSEGVLVYKGEMHNNAVNGYGTLYYTETGKVKYEGNWKDGKFDGYGTLYDEDGEIEYKGEWKKGDYAN